MHSVYLTLPVTSKFNFCCLISKKTVQVNLIILLDHTDLVGILYGWWMAMMPYSCFLDFLWRCHSIDSPNSWLSSFLIKLNLASLCLHHYLHPISHHQSCSDQDPTVRMCTLYALQGSLSLPTQNPSGTFDGHQISPCPNQKATCIVFATLHSSSSMSLISIA